MTRNFKNSFLLYSCLIILAVIIVYYPALKNGILQWDDNLYVTDNNAISSLLNIPGFFKSFNVSNYQPLTMITYSLIYHFGGTAPFLYHFVNVLFHIFNSLLVFYFVYELTKNHNLSLVVGLLFSLHPLHVESVAWIAELKDVQYAFFFFLSLIFYLKFIRQKSLFLYASALFLFLLSLLSKGQAVALLPTLFLIDYFEKGKIFTRVAEKIPFLILSLIFGIVAIIAQKSDNTIGDYTALPIFGQMVLACYGFTMYIIKILVPFNLSAFYPYPVLTVGTSLFDKYYIFLLAIPLTICLLIISFKKNKIIFFGFVFFIVNIILLLQLIPVGNCIMADRYTYVSSVGLNLILASWILKCFDSKNNWIIFISLFVFYLIFLSVKTYAQVTKWKNDFTLWDNVLSVNPDIPSALILRGCSYNDKEEYDKALIDFNRAIGLGTKDGLAFFNRGIAKSRSGDFKGAIEDFKIADKLKLSKKYLFNFYVSWGGAAANTGALNDAMKLFDQAIAIDAENASVYNNRGITKVMLGDNNGAIADFDRAVKLKPDFKDAIINRSKALKLILSRKFDK